MGNFNFDPRGEVHCEGCKLPERICKCSELVRLRNQVAMLKKQLAQSVKEVNHQRGVAEAMNGQGVWDPTHM